MKESERVKDREVLAKIELFPFQQWPFTEAANRTYLFADLDSSDAVLAYLWRACPSLLMPGSKNFPSEEAQNDEVQVLPFEPHEKDAGIGQI